MKNENTFTVQSFVLINATASKIWDVLINPEKVKAYLYGSNVITDWKVGSQILFTRNRLYPQAPISKKLIVDKGRIIAIEKERLLEFSFYSSVEGYEDVPENYSVISYELSRQDHSFRLDYRRTNIPMEFEKRNQDKFMPGMMAQIKMLAEN